MTDPYVSIGLPVYNGERFVDRAIETLLDQDFTDFELVISDNGSTDRTEEICRRYAALDSRIRYVRHPDNRGAAWNFCHVLDIANPGARYMKWAAADDEHAPTYLSTTVAMLDADPTASLAHTGTADIDEEGYVLKVWHQPVDHLLSPDPAERIRDLITLRHECFGAFGLIRQEVARATRGLGAYSDADNVLLVEIALRGRMLQADETLFFRRQHPDRSTIAFPHARGRVEWFESGRSGALTFPVWRIGREFAHAIEHAPLTAAERRACYASLGVFVHENWQGLTKNVIRSAVEATGVAARRIRRGRTGRGRAVASSGLVTMVSAPAPPGAPTATVTVDVTSPEARAASA